MVYIICMRPCTHYRAHTHLQACILRFIKIYKNLVPFTVFCFTCEKFTGIAQMQCTEKGIENASINLKNIYIYVHSPINESVSYTHLDVYKRQVYDSV